MTILLRQKPLTQVVRQIVQRDNGAWFDPSDMSTMYQDAAGTTPVTAVEQPVGLILDKSQGLMLGPELVSNGDFSNGLTGWTAGVGISVVNGELVCATTSNERAEQAGTYSFNKTYVVTLNISSYSSGGAFVTIGQGGAVTIPSPQSLGRKTVYVKAGSADSILRFYPGGFGVGGTLTIDNISVREIYGNHATQSVTASRPTLSARKNVLLATETLATQSVTTIAAKYCLSFWGTGSVTLLGTATNVLTGTSADNRVWVEFTPTAGTLTLTVSGTVSKAQLELTS